MLNGRSIDRKNRDLMELRVFDGRIKTEHATSHQWFIMVVSGRFVIYVMIASMNIKHDSIFEEEKGNNFKFNIFSSKETARIEDFLNF